MGYAVGDLSGLSQCEFRLLALCITPRVLDLHFDSIFSVLDRGADISYGYRDPGSGSVRAPRIQGLDCPSGPLYADKPVGTGSVVAGSDDTELDVIGIKCDLDCGYSHSLIFILPGPLLPAAF